MIKKLSILALILILAISSFAACGGGTTNTVTQTPEEETPELEGYKDGEWYGEASGYSEQGWKDNATVTIVNGEIANIVWNATNTDASVGDKQTLSREGKYDITVAGGQKPWHEEAEDLCAYIVANQDPASVNILSDGKTDSVSTCTVTVTEFMEALEVALAQAE